MKWLGRDYWGKFESAQADENRTLLTYFNGATEHSLPQTKLLRKFFIQHFCSDRKISFELELDFQEFNFDANYENLKFENLIISMLAA